jgi:hypothetical protein
MDFYAFLPSNASPNVYPDNKTSDFKIELSRRIELHGRWQAALIEIHYPNTFEQVTQLSNEITFETELDIEKYTIKPGYYSNTSALLRALEEAVPPVTWYRQTVRSENIIPVVFTFTEDHRFVMNPFSDDPSAKISFSPPLAHQLGLDNPGPFPANQRMEGVKPMDLSLGITPQMFVYMDILADQIIGHTCAPLLRTVPVDVAADFGSMSVFYCDHPLYFDLNTKSFDTVQINIRDHTGKLASFAYGTATLLVHFKQLPL